MCNPTALCQLCSRNRYFLQKQEVEQVMMSFQPSPVSEDTCGWRAEGLALLPAPRLPDCEKNCERRQWLRTLSGTRAPRGGSAGEGTETKQKQRGEKVRTDSQTWAILATRGICLHLPWSMAANLLWTWRSHDCRYLNTTFATWHLNLRESSSTLVQGQPPFWAFAWRLHSFLLQIQVLKHFVSLSVLYMQWTLECSQVFQHLSENWQGKRPTTFYVLFGLICLT